MNSSFGGDSVGLENILSLAPYIDAVFADLVSNFVNVILLIAWII